jgi:hypothetical protein
MIERNECLEFLNKRVGIGVKHLTIPDRLFFYYGKLLKVNYDSVKIKIPEGYKLIFLSDIIEIKLVPYTGEGVQQEHGLGGAQ